MPTLSLSGYSATPDRALRREDGDTYHVCGVVANVMRPVRALREADGVTRLEPALALRRAQCRGAADHDQPLLVGPFEVVRADRLVGRQVVDAHPEQLRADVLAHARRSRQVVAGRFVAGRAAAVSQHRRLSATRSSTPAVTSWLRGGERDHHHAGEGDREAPRVRAERDSRQDRRRRPRATRG